jgi:hypothetical protein
MAKNPWDPLMFVIKCERGWLHFNDFFLTKKGDFFFLSFFIFSGGNLFNFPKNSITQHWKFRKKKKKKKKALLYSMQIIIELKEMDETKITPFHKTQKNSHRFAHELDVYYSCEQFLTYFI